MTEFKPTAYLHFIADAGEPSGPKSDHSTWIGISGSMWSGKGDISQAQKQIAAQGKPPEEALLEATRKNRVVGIGDIHGPLGPQLSFLADEMPKLKDAGVTHLAVEIPGLFQKNIDDWSAADQEFLRSKLKDKSSLINVIEQAKLSGIKVVGVDDFYGANGEKLASRDRTMAKNIMGILDDPTTKVAFLVGAEHLQDGIRQDSFGPSAADLLRRKGVSIPTFYPQISSAQDALMPVARSLVAPLNIDRAHYGDIGKLAVASGVGYNKWDNVMLFPPHYKMEGVEAELKQFGKDPKDELRDAVANNKAVLLGEMPRAVPEQELDPHRNFIKETLADLKAQGLTDLAIDIPPAYAERLEQSGQNGELGPLPGTYDRDDFKAIINEAKNNGIRLHAIGNINESIMAMKDILDELAQKTQQIANEHPNNKVLVWCSEEKVAKFKDEQGKEVSVGKSLNDAGIKTTTYAGFSQDFTDWSLGLVTEITPKPTSIDPSKTKLLREVSNTEHIAMERFEHVIIYPSPGN